MTQAEYARHRGVTRQTIHELVGKGKIPYRVDDDDTKLINPADADFALGEARERVDDDDEDENTDGFAARPAPEPTLTRARTATEIYRARIAELQYQRLRGELAPVADVKDAADRCALALVAELEQLPARADEIAAAWAANGLPGVRGVLKAIVRELRTKAADRFTQMAAEAATDAGARSEAE
jgi:hypothetical protein